MTEIWTREKQEALTPRQALALLKEGNRRFLENVRLNRDLREQRERTAAAQFPFAFILTCVDSRTAPELLFDLGIGEAFVGRVAGNGLNEDLLGSMEFACCACGVPLILVLGHTGCGAVAGACRGVQLGHLTQLLERLAPLVEEARREGVAEEALVDLVAERHVWKVVAEIPEKSPLLRARIEEGRLAIFGAFYEMASGKVRFLDGLSGAAGRGG